MAYSLTFPLNSNLDTGHFGIPKGAAGRSGHSIVGICLHVLESTIETYSAYLRSVRGLADIRPLEHGSVHYAASADGTVHQFVADTNTAWGIQGLVNPTWTLLNDYVGINPNYLFIHVAVEKYISAQIPTLMFRGLADLVTYLCVLHDIDIDAAHIIDHTQLEDTFEDCGSILAANLIATVSSLAAAGNTGVSQDISVLAAQLAALQTQVDNLSDDFDAALATINTYAAHVTAVAGTSTLGHLKASSTLDINGSTGVAAVKTLAAAYQIVSGTQTVVASIQAIVQFPTVISDALAWATLGGAWKITISVAGLYRLRTRLEFSPATWTAGKMITLSCYKNGVLLETIAVKTIEANLTTKSVDVQGECNFVAATLTDYYQVAVITDDANGLKTIVSGNVVVEKIGA